MRVRPLVLAILLANLLAACKSSQPPPPGAGSAQGSAPARKPPDEMDERMRHCPVALEGATSTLVEIEGGVRFTLEVPESQVAEARRRARHIVEFAAKRTREGHGEFDGKGGGQMRNCPVVTSGVTIEVADTPGGAQIDIRATDRAQLEQLRAETRRRVERFPFVGATITIADANH